MGISITGGVKVPQGKFSVGPAVVGFTANAVRFDGTNDWLNRGAALDGAADNDTLLLSFWFDLSGGDATNLAFFGAEAGHFIVRRLSTDVLRFGFSTAAELFIWAFSSGSTFLAAAGWVHVLISIDASAGKRLVYIDDAVPSITAVTENAGDIDWTATDFSVGSNISGGMRLDADVAEFYMTNEFLDIGVEANRRKFISSGGKPVDLNSDGSGPTGTQPLIYLSGATASWHTNDGSGGGFTENGALTDGASSPSD